MPTSPHGTVVAVSSSPKHHFSKTQRDVIRLLEGLGVEGDAHMGEKVKHRSRARFNPSLPNLRQVHLLHQELFDELETRGFVVKPGEMGENITTRGVDILALPKGTRLHIGASAVIELTGLRNPCVQIDRFQPGLMDAVLERDDAGKVTIRKSGVMSVVLASGEVRAGDVIRVEIPAEPWTPLAPV